MPTQFTPARQKALVHAFQSFDFDQDGLLHPEEVLGILLEMGLEADLDMAEAIVKCMDTDGDGQLSIAELQNAKASDLAKLGMPGFVPEPLDPVEAAVQKLGEAFRHDFQSLEDAFLAVDEDDNGEITINEFQTVVGLKNIEITEADLGLVFGRFGADGTFSYAAFCECLEEWYSEPIPEIMRKPSPPRRTDSVIPPRLPPKAGPHGVRGVATAPPQTADVKGRLKKKQQKKKEDKAASANIVVDDQRMDMLLALVREKALQSYKTVEAAFHKIDRDKSGTVSKKELTLFLKTYNVRIKPQELTALVARYDKNGDGEVSYDEFVTEMGEALKRMPSIGSMETALYGSREPSM